MTVPAPEFDDETFLRPANEAIATRPGPHGALRGHRPLFPDCPEIRPHVESRSCYADQSRWGIRDSRSESWPAVDRISGSLEKYAS